MNPAIAVVESTPRRGPKVKSPPKRLLRKSVLDANGCIVYTGKVANSNGYPRTNVPDPDSANGWRMEYGHRIMYAHCAGIPISELDDGGRTVILHRCDNRRCLRPGHLYRASEITNMRDRDSKNRQSKGEAHGLAKLSSLQALTAVRDLQDGVAPSEIARDMGVSAATIRSIRYGRSWNHVTGVPKAPLTRARPRLKRARS
jgi:hypothetical protein